MSIYQTVYFKYVQFNAFQFYRHITITHTHTHTLRREERSEYLAPVVIMDKIYTSKVGKL